MKLYTRKKNQELQQKLISILSNNFIVLNWSYDSSQDLYSTIKWLAIFYYFSWPFKQYHYLEKKWKLKYFRNKNIQIYKNLLCEMTNADEKFFFPYYWFSYNELYESGKLEEIINIYQWFYLKNISWEDINNFVLNIWEEYELFFYFLCDGILNHKLYHDQKNNITDVTLISKMKEYSYSSGEYNLVV